MKMAKKIVALLLCALLLVGASVAGTLAYLTSKAEVKNTFTVGQVVLGDDDTNGLDEADVDEYGRKLNNRGAVWKEGDTLATRVVENEYKLIPGHSYTKDPTVHVGANSEACYLFVEVENGIAAIEAGTKIEAQILANGWIHYKDNIYYQEAEATGDEGADFPVFGSFKLADNADVASYADKNITVTAYAIQKDGMDDENEAWAALEAAYPNP